MSECGLRQQVRVTGGAEFRRQPVNARQRGAHQAGTKGDATHAQVGQFGNGGRTRPGHDVYRTGNFPHEAGDDFAILQANGENAVRASLAIGARAFDGLREAGRRVANAMQENIHARVEHQRTPAVAAISRSALMRSVW